MVESGEATIWGDVVRCCRYFDVATDTQFCGFSVVGDIKRGNWISEANMWGGKWRLVWRAASYIFLIWGRLYWLGAATGGTNPLQPLDLVKTPSALLATSLVAKKPIQPTPLAHFQTIKTMAELDATIATATPTIKKS